MTIEVTLSTEGHLNFAQVQQVLESAGCSPVTFEVKELNEPGAEMTIGYFAFKDPDHRRKPREMRVHHFKDPDSETEAHITGDDYTYCVMGAHGGGPRAMQALAEVFGGKLCNDIGDTEELFERPGSPAP